MNVVWLIVTEVLVTLIYCLIRRHPPQEFFVRTYWMTFGILMGWWYT